ncbi:hypothetical protein KC622_01855 [Candidatus Dojkabacteria bacterium]|uniref:Cytochrome b5 heme-binding domain-containing protein n=1 Tax=Candidatus Dojkabacteria bacterium TaxID=2099670 RepID=A0A955HXX7_9BACT|nr:hypothetical protein [Candidatus Dojkabacteria bacterium]MCB9790954.1 hypothetical protein [Candidatus Nomurabacteria bacterium]
MKSIFTIFTVGFVILLAVVLLSGSFKKGNNGLTSVVTQQTATSTPSSTVSGSGSSQGATTSPVTDPNSCIITIQGHQYDVTQLRRTHSGGDIFICGTDMTQTFFSMHNSQLLNGQMQRYLVK